MVLDKHILDSQVFRGKLEYLVHWKGYGIEEGKWRLAEDVKGAKKSIATFHWRNSVVPLDFIKLPLCPHTNFTDTLDMVPADWATG